MSARAYRELVDELKKKITLELEPRIALLTSERNEAIAMWKQAEKKLAEEVAIKHAFYRALLNMAQRKTT